MAIQYRSMAGSAEWDGWVMTHPTSRCAYCCFNMVNSCMGYEFALWPQSLFTPTETSLFYWLVQYCILTLCYSLISGSVNHNFPGGTCSQSPLMYNEILDFWMTQPGNTAEVFHQVCSRMQMMKVKLLTEDIHVKADRDKLKQKMPMTIRQMLKL